MLVGFEDNRDVDRRTAGGRRQRNRDGLPRHSTATFVAGRRRAGVALPRS